MLTQEDLEAMGCTLPFLEERERKQLKPEHLCNANLKLADCVEEMPESYVSQIKTFFFS